MIEATKPPHTIVLHLGAHKTASTHLARTLMHNNSMLKQYGIYSPKKIEIRASITNYANPSKKRADVTDEERDLRIAKAGHGQARIIVPDENIIGAPRNVFEKGIFYPAGARRLRRLLRYLTGYQVELFLTIRDPATFIPSCYCETVRNRGYIDFDQYMGNCNMEDVIWSNFIERLLSIVPQKTTLSVWCYEDYLHKADDIIKIIAGLPGSNDANFDKISEVVRPGLSQRALDEIKAQDEMHGLVVPKKEREMIHKAFPKSPTFPGPQIFDDVTRNRLSRQYVEDVERLRHMERVRLIEPITSTQYTRWRWVIKVLNSAVELLGYREYQSERIRLLGRGLKIS